MCENIYSKTNSSGKVAILNAEIQNAADPSEDVRRSAVDHLVQIDPIKFRDPGVAATADIIPILEMRLQKETSSEMRGHIQRIIEALRR
jgi:hypothetical protein